MSSQPKDGEDGGLFSFSENLGAMGKLSPRIKELKSKLANLPKGRESRGERKKIQKELNELRAISKRAFLKVLGGGGIIAGAAASGLALLADGGSPDEDADTAKRADNGGLPRHTEVPEGIGIKEFTTIEPAELTAEEEIMRMVELQRYWKKMSEEALMRFKDTDPRVKQLTDFMEKHAFYSISVGPVATLKIGLGKPAAGKDTQDNPFLDPHGFEIVYMPEQYAKNMASSILTEKEGRTMRIAASFRSKEWLGIMLAHELKHVHDQLMEGEDAQDPKQYNLGEVRAHLFEMNLLRAWNPRTYDFLLERGIPLYKEAHKTGNLGELVRLIKSLYPVGYEVSQAEARLGLASCIMAIAFTEAQQRGASEKDLVRVYLYLRNSFGKRPQR